MQTFTLIATTAFGLESVVARELQQLGYRDTKSFNGHVEFNGTIEDIPRVNLWLRTADRVVIKVGQFRATTFEELFEQTKALPWPELMPRDANFPVEGRSVKSQLSSEPACQSIVKKAIVESMKKKYKVEMFPETGARYDIEVALLKDEVTLTLDTSGVGLHKRGYRKLSAVAPIKETLAAAMVLLSRWEPHRVFADPMCGSGTIAIEAALIGKNIAPGLRRKFVSESWDWIPSDAWKHARDEAKSLERSHVEMRVLASDYDPDVLSLAEYHARQAGVGEHVYIQERNAASFTYPEPYGCIVSNPPYGERLGERPQVEALYKNLGRVFRNLDKWSLFVITSHPDFEKLFGKPADKKRKLYNGRIQTNFYQYLGPLPPRNSTSVPHAEEIL